MHITIGTYSDIIERMYRMGSPTMIIDPVINEGSNNILIAIMSAPQNPRHEHLLAEPRYRPPLVAS